VAVAVVANRLIGWVGVVFIGSTSYWILVWWLVFNVDWVGSFLMEHLISVDSFLDVVVNATGLWVVGEVGAWSDCVI
jgi:hypothetical protein